MVGGNWLKSIFFLFLDHLPGFPNYTFLNFQKKFFSLQPTAVSLRALAELPVASGGRTNFKLESLHSGEEFMVRDALVVSKFSDDVNTLPHAVDTTTLKHFQGVHIPVAPGRAHLDVLIGLADKSLLAVLEEREGSDPEEPNHVLTRLGPIASGGKINAFTSFSNSLSTLRVNI